MTDVVERAKLMAQRGDVQGAVTTLQNADGAGDASAARQLAIWHLTGQFFPRDLSASRRLFGRSADLGDSVAAAVSRAFTANGTGGPSDWPLAVAMLRSAAGEDQDAAAQLTVIDAMSLTEDGDPTRPFERRQLSGLPEIWHYPALLTPQECSYCISAAAPLMEPSVVIDPATGRHMANPIRTSQAAAFPFVNENPAIHAINRRLAAASGTDVRCGEPLQVLRYDAGQEYRLHSDALPGVAREQQRVLTFLVYLNADYEGGETEFPKIGLSFKGQTGDGLLFRSIGADGQPDPLSLHAGRPVKGGVKQLASRWIRSEPLKIS